MSSRRWMLSVVLVLVLACIALSGSPAVAFTQSGVATIFGDGIPMGHEWLTRMAALEILGGDTTISPDPNDPRIDWPPDGRAKDPSIAESGAKAEADRIRARRTDENRYASTYKAVYDAIIGERWVDIGGFDVTKTNFINKYNCFNGVAQEPPTVQYDHFMRRPDDGGGDGAIRALKSSQERFADYFVQAAMAPQMMIRVWDGGGTSSTVDVESNYFLFGRAVHIFQDSFSSEHTVRLQSEFYQRVHQIKSYACARNSEQHTHDQSEVSNYTSGDVIWKKGTQWERGWSSYKPSNMKTDAIVAAEASKDLWAAFIRTMGTPLEQRKEKAKSEANVLVKNWLSFKESDVRDWYDDQSHRDESYVMSDDGSGTGQKQSACVKNLGESSGDQEKLVKHLMETQKVCLYNIQYAPGYADVYDRALHLPYNWTWRTAWKNWIMPPADYQLENRDAFTGRFVTIRSVANGQPMVSDQNPPINNAWVYCRAGEPLQFVMEWSDHGRLRLRYWPGLFLSFTATTGAVKLHDSASEVDWRIEPRDNNSAILNLYWKQYLWLKDTSPYLTKEGDPANGNARWVVETRP